MNRETAHEFAAEWLQAWNRLDIDAVLSHFSDDVVFSSPVAARVVEGSGGVITGKAALREYWLNAARLIPDLHFEIEGLYVGVDTLVIHYRNQAGRLVNEVLRLRDGLVVEGHGTYHDAV